MRELERAAGDDPAAAAALIAAQIRASHDPRRDPLEGDVVEVAIRGWSTLVSNATDDRGQARQRRRVVARHLSRKLVTWALDPRPDGLPYGEASRTHTCLVSSWRRWARGGTVRVVAEDTGDCPKGGTFTGPCAPRVRDGRCIWCERELPPAGALDLPQLACTCGYRGPVSGIDYPSESRCPRCGEETS